MNYNSSIQSIIRKTVNKTGFDIIRFKPQVADILVSKYGINSIFDVGANIGQYALRKRKRGYVGKMISFEPLSDAFTELTKKTKNDPLWNAVNIGLADYDGEASINISQASVFSSMLNPAPLLNQIYPEESKYISKETITVCKIDSIFNDYYNPGDKVFMKIDAQGYEENILKGAESSFEYITGMQLELSFVPHYESELIITQIVENLAKKDFTLVSLEPLSHNLSAGNLLQADGIFVRLN